MSVVFPVNSLRSRMSRSQVIDDLHAQEPRWFAVRVGFRKEKVAAKHLQRKGIHCYLPLRERPYHYASKTGVRQLPLLGGYLFVKIVRGEANTVLATNFVSGFVKLGSERRQVTPAEIELLRRISTDKSLEWAVEEKLGELTAGSLVEICRGPLAGVKGYYLRAKNKKTFVITFGGLDARLVTCEIAPENVVPLSGPGLDHDDQPDRKQLW